jgi:hypothetical protein
MAPKIKDDSVKVDGRYDADCTPEPTVENRLFDVLQFDGRKAHSCQTESRLGSQPSEIVYASRTPEHTVVTR